MQKYAHGLHPMTEAEFYARNRKSQKDIKSGKLHSQEEVKKRFASRK